MSLRDLIPKGDVHDHGEAPIVKLANAIIEQGIAEGASDIHVEPREKSMHVRLRVDGILYEFIVIPKNLQDVLLRRFKVMAGMDIAKPHDPQDGRIDIEYRSRPYQLRASSLPAVFGEDMALRILDPSSPVVGLDKIGMSDSVRASVELITTQPSGIFLCTGPTGSGKSTTLYSILKRLNTSQVKVLTCEEPIEYEMQGITQVPIRRKGGLTFATALRSFLRQDPDIIMVGEIRDRETAEIAIEASLTGHLVLSTLHTSDAPSAISRLVNMGIEPYLLAATVSGVLAQRLARKVDEQSREPYELMAMDLRHFGMKVGDPDEPITLYRGIPTKKNRMTGYAGRTGIHELLVMNQEIADAIVDRAPVSRIRVLAKEHGMKELVEDGLEKILAGVTDPAEIRRVLFTAGF